MTRDVTFVPEFDDRNSVCAYVVSVKTDSSSKGWYIALATRFARCEYTAVISILSRSSSPEVSVTPTDGETTKVKLSPDGDYHSAVVSLPVHSAARGFTIACHQSDPGAASTIMKIVLLKADGLPMAVKPTSLCMMGATSY